MVPVSRLSVKEWNIPLEEPFSFALGTVSEIENALVTVEAEDGTVGCGEASPFPPVTGETQGSVMSIVRQAAPLVEDEHLQNYRRTTEEIRSLFAGNPTALFAIETAVLDAYCRSRGMSMAELVGGTPRPVDTALTLPATDPEDVSALARTATSLGYDVLKMKADGDRPTDEARVREASTAAPDTRIIVDANQAYTPKNAVRLVESLREDGVAIDLLEQPVSRTDIEGLGYVRSSLNVPVAADEAVATPADAFELARRNAADLINVKLGKSGFLGAMEIAAIATAADLQLMIGCMVESKIGIHTSAHLAAGTGSFRYIDLDGQPRLPKELGRTRRGPRLELDGPGHGLRPEDVSRE